MRVLGIDPGLNCTGYAVLEVAGAQTRVHEAGAITTSRSASLAERLVEIHDELDRILGEHRPDQVAVESLYVHYRHPRTAIVMGHVRGVVLFVAGRRATPVLDLPAMQIKRVVTGSGHASKEQVQRAVQMVLGLARPPQPADVADACAIALAAVQDAAAQRLEVAP